MQALHPDLFRIPGMSKKKAERLRRRDERGAQRLRRREQEAEERERRTQERQKKQLGLSPEEGGMDRYWDPD